MQLPLYNEESKEDSYYLKYIAKSLKRKGDKESY